MVNTTKLSVEGGQTQDGLPLSIVQVRFEGAFERGRLTIDVTAHLEPNITQSISDLNAKVKEAVIAAPSEG